MVTVITSIIKNVCWRYKNLGIDECDQICYNYHIQNKEYSMIGIYKLTFNGTDKVYIGKSEDLAKREKEHLAHLRRGTHSIKMNEAYNKYGTPKLEILCECLEEELDEFEEETIEIYNAVDNGFNTLYKAGDTPDNTGILNGMSKYPKKLLLKAFSLLYRTNETLLHISKRLGIQISTLSSISNGYRHLWLKKQYPEKYSLMLNKRRNLTPNVRKYPDIKGPDGIIYQITNVRDFCRNHPLLETSGYSHLNSVMTGKRKQHKGFTLANPEEAVKKQVRPTLIDPDGVEYVNISSITGFCSEHLKLAGNINARKGISRVLNGERSSYLGFMLKSSS